MNHVVPAAGRILVVGATGYVGGRLLRLLEQRGHRIRCLVRRPEFLAYRVGTGTEVVAGDLAIPDSLPAALAGIDTAFYLAHAMGSTGDLEEEERRGAMAFAAAAREARVRRIIYLGGLGEGPRLSAHLRSRQEVGRILRESGVPTIELRAAIIVGSGSLSFDMIRSLVERLPVMITPRWVGTLTQPIAIEDVLAYLVAAMDLVTDASQVVEIGGPDRVSYGDIMREYARLRGLRRWMIPIPVLSPRLSSLWLRIVTPVYARVGRKLIDGLRNETVVHSDTAARLFSIKPLGIKAALTRALANEDQAFAATRWSDSAATDRAPRSWAGVRFGTRLVDSRTVVVARPPALAFAPIQRIGGRAGWYYGNLLWRIRGYLDLAVGGPGLRRGRRDPVEIQAGDTIDFWRVEQFEPDHLLQLSAEMRLPGRAWLQFEVVPTAGGSIVRQTATFDPAGVAGLAYWYLLYPLHQLIFAGMLRAVAKRAG